MTFIKGYEMTEEHKRKIGMANKNKKLSIEHRLKLSQAKLGKKRGPRSEEHRKKIGLPQIGSKNHNWKGGRTKTVDGYIWIKNRTHPKAHNGYVPEHRLVIEQQIGRYLFPEETVHHRGIKYPLGSIENKQDNRPENLMIFINNSAHLRFHKNPLNVKPEEIIFDKAS